MIKDNWFTELTDVRSAQRDPGFCKFCRIYPCELVPEYLHFKNNHPQFFRGNHLKELFSYDPKELKHGCIMGPGTVRQINCGRENVTDGIGNAYRIKLTDDFKVKKGIDGIWEPPQPVFISAQTGQGKNYFIEETLVPYIKELNHKNRTSQRILILSNRRALRKQIEARKNGEDCTVDTKFRHAEFVDVMTYQSLLNQTNWLTQKQEENSSRYIFVICDEAHFFTSDAMFNPDTEKILSLIVSLFKSAVRVYMSATPYDCLDVILKHEIEYRANPKNGKPYIPMAFYHFKRDYSYLDMKSFSKWDDLLVPISNSVEEGERWLIFIDNINMCTSFQRTLIDYNPDLKTKIHTLDARAKKDDVYESIIMEEKLDDDTYILITTSVLDNGVNLNGIQNIVVSDTSKVKVLQMVGRARVRGTTTKKTLFIKRFTEKEVSNKVIALKKQEIAYYDYDMAYGENSSTNQEYIFLNKYYNGQVEDWESAKHWFGRSPYAPSKLYPNEIAKKLVKRQLTTHKNILTEMQAEAMYSLAGHQYLAYQLSWFGKTYDDLDKARKAFFAFLDKYADSGESIDKDKMDEFSETFTVLYNAVFAGLNPDKKRLYKFKKMNEALELNAPEYRLEGKEKIGPWKVCRTTQDTESLDSDEVIISCSMSD